MVIQSTDFFNFFLGVNLGHGTEFQAQYSGGGLDFIEVRLYNKIRIANIM